MWQLVVLIILGSVLTGIFKSRWFKGAAGEFLVNLSFKLRLDKDTYHLIKNVTLPTESGTTQIDHIIVSIFGVFVIETKNMKGWIFGSEHQKTWTQKIYKHKNTFQNPLRQNYKHTKTLETLLGLKSDHLFSVVVFIGDSTFKTSMPENVTYGRGCADYIKSKLQSVLSPAEMEDIINKIESGRLTPSFKTHREHVRHVKESVREKEAAVLCPQCQSPMKLKTAKKGANRGNKFWGCSQYPRCYGTRDI